MKSTIIAVILVCFSSHLLQAQDIIVTNEGDTLNCKITKVKKDYIYFVFKHKEDIRRTLVPVSSVSYHQVDFFPTSELGDVKVNFKEDYPHLRFGINGGYSYLTAKIDESIPHDFTEYMNDLKSGFHIGADLTYYFNEPLGFGLKLNSFRTSNQVDNIYISDVYGARRYGKLEDNISVLYVAPVFSTRFFNHKKTNAFLMNISMGYLGYKNNATVVDSYNMEGSTIGLSLDLAYDVGISDNLALSFQLSFLGGSLTEYDVYARGQKEHVVAEKGEYESLSRVDLSIGFSFRK